MCYGAGCRWLLFVYLSAPSGLAAKVYLVAAALRRRLLRFPKKWIDARSWQLTMKCVLAI